MNRLTPADPQPERGSYRSLYWVAGAIATTAIAAALLGQAFPGSPDVPGAACDAPGAAGCTRADTWPFMAALLGGPLTAIFLLTAIASHVLSEARAAKARRSG